MEKTDLAAAVAAKTKADYEEALVVSRYVTAIGIYRFLDAQIKELRAQEAFLVNGPERLAAVRARLEVVEHEKIGARKAMQETREKVPAVVLGRIGNVEDGINANAAQSAAEAISQ